jgi:hypothetical protein
MINGPLARHLMRVKDKMNRQTHNAAVDAARARGADFHCAQLIGFAATDDPPTKAKVCATCQRKGIAS